MWGKPPFYPGDNLAVEVRKARYSSDFLLTQYSKGPRVDGGTWHIGWSGSFGFRRKSVLPVPGSGRKFHRSMQRAL